MPRFIVKADGYSIEFNGLKSLEYQNIKLIPLENHLENITKGKKEKVPYQTCIAELNVNNIEQWENAIEKTEEILDEFSIFLAFAYGHDVFFQNFRCYKSEEGSEELIGSRCRSMLLGKMHGGSNCFYPYGIQNFIDCGFENFLDEDFNKRFGIRRAILWYNLGLDYEIAEVTFSFHFIALEILANYFAKENPIEPSLSKENYLKLKRKLIILYGDLGITEWKDIHSKICGEIQRISIKNKISSLLKSDLYELNEYESIAHSFVDLRNMIFHEGHGDIVEEHGGWGTILRQIEKLLSKIILKNLNCYNIDGLHASIISEDLLAR